MSDRFSITPLPKLLKIILQQYDYKQAIFGIPEELFFKAEDEDAFQMMRFGESLETPIGVAAGPHTQLAQNIVASWLCGARYIELKTIQTLDEIEVSKPCIDMQDEGYNCEWSQELKVRESFDQYLDAWIIIHILKHKFAWSTTERGFIFNMSVGYDYEGMLKPNVQWFLDKMKDAGEELQRKIESVEEMYPGIKDLDISHKISDNITLSTMHGCPPGEIQRIAEYLIKERKLHTAIKLNPTLLGKEELHKILNASGFDTVVPNEAFEHDLKYPEAIDIIRALEKDAKESGRQFSIKLTNTLESINHKNVFPESEKMMYMSGRALHPISVQLAGKLQNEFNGKLDISFSGGVDAFNVAEVVACDLAPITVCTDILKPGGYGRLHQYIDELRKHPSPVDLDSIPFLDLYSKQVIENKSYLKTGIHDPDIKTSRTLGWFDCTHAPCEDSCPTHQGIPDYMFHTSKGDLPKAAETILKTNPFPNTTGMVCDHVCQSKCTRLNYDGPLLIREIKRFVAETALSSGENAGRAVRNIEKAPSAAIIGAGPSGLSCAYFLAKAGFAINVYESKETPGGMVSGAIPSFRLTDEAFTLDYQRIVNLGVKFHYHHPINKKTFDELRGENDYLYIAAGAQRSKPLIIDGMEAKGVLDPLDFLFKAKSGEETGIGKHVVIIGGGNTAMDAARTAYRLVGKNGNVSIVYRRTVKQMPADLGEIKAVMEEGVRIMELISPKKVLRHNDKVVSLLCSRMSLGEKDSSGRATPIEIPASEFEIPADTIIAAVGQDLDIDFLEEYEHSSSNDNYATGLDNVFIGGDALRGASTAINAIGDGRKAAQQIINRQGINFNTNQKEERAGKSLRQHMINRASRITPQELKETSLDNRRNFNLVSSSLSEEEAIKESSRCLLCDEVCNICTTLCPNLALMSYEIQPEKLQLRKIIQRDGKIEVLNDGFYEISQEQQILHLPDWCNHCGNCTTFCPSAGSPYLDKPHFYFSREAFDEAENGFLLLKDGNNPILYAKRDGNFYSLANENDKFRYSSKDIDILMNKSTFEIIDYEVKGKENFEVGSEMAVIMSIIIRAAESLYL